MDAHLVDGVRQEHVERWIPTVAVLHSNGDGMQLGVARGRIVGVRGRADDRVNHGRLDPKGLYGWQANGSRDRLTVPLVREAGELVEATWDEAMDRIVRRTTELLAERGPSAIGFHTSGQLFAEEYYTLAAIARGGPGTSHLDGNITRPCTATAASVKESFGCDGQPGSYTDVDHADTIALFGHNVAATQAVLWSRILDRLAGPNPPALLCVDPRTTPAAKAATLAVQVNTLHLIRGTLGRPGAGVLQMNGQPTAQNARECGADGDLTGFRGWANPKHIDELAALWKMDRAKLDHGKPPAHAMKMSQYAEEGTLGLLWVSATNPAVSLPEPRRVRRILRGESLSLVVQDGFPTETADLADVVLPAALWDEKTGVFTNAARTVHFSGKAVEPPGSARSDLDILLDFVRRLDLRDQAGDPFPDWHDSESAFEAWKAAGAGRPCDYTGLTHERLRSTGPVQWFCDDRHPDGTERLDADGRFSARPEHCENYGHDLISGTPIEVERHRAYNSDGRAMIRARPYVSAPEGASADHPFSLITGRSLYQFHTRTKTARVPELDRAAPDVWVGVAASDAAAFGFDDGRLAEITTPRGMARATVRIGEIRPGVRLPFHYGYWDVSEPEGGHRAANELTRTDWDPVSKQPVFKLAAARIAAVEPDTPSPVTSGSGPENGGAP
ncbi:molybdopterin oxidoreductase family protein [Actinoalloteichus hoggarensis]|uniref:molybdopterin oxidoreductase family protein n=1 Tax=Actinoalloteichus hoggarensis TaxID=1470176 RepID=UPI001FE7F48F|nr:molybdopterin-dependent oxidoreductase [Actinoalloteichus hoggarensis]